MTQKQKTKTEIRNMIAALDERAQELFLANGEKDGKTIYVHQWATPARNEYLEIIAKMESLFWVIGARTDHQIKNIIP